MEFKDIKYSIKFFTYWQCGSGLGSGADVDVMPIKNSNKLPYVPGKTIKGLLKEAIEVLPLDYDSKDFVNVFGVGDNNNVSEEDNKEDIYKINGSFFTNAILLEDESRIIVQDNLQPYLYTKVSSTALKNGVAAPGSLRSMEVVIPCTLSGEIYNVPNAFVDTISKGLKLIKRLGTNRNRGYGSCSLEIITSSDPIFREPSTKINGTIDNIYRFKCTLLSDLIISQHAGTESAVRSTLDYIPGNIFLGIVARQYTDFKYPVDIFHNGKVKFSDAHLACDNRRTYKIPLAMCYDKNAPSIHYRYHLISDYTCLKQLIVMRDGFYDFSTDSATKVKVVKRLSLKSAHDRNTRASDAGNMFCYESIEGGKTFYFQVDMSQIKDRDEDTKLVLKSIIGNHRIGASHSAEYGLVEIEQVECYKEDNKVDIICTIPPSESYIYAESRLIFLDEYGYPRCNITAKDLGFDGDAKINWQRSQVRTFQFAPWNGKRAVRDSDRWGFEKGSVFIVEKAKPIHIKYVGSYHQEGFGSVLVNPSFLLPHSEEDKSKYSLNNSEENKSVAVLSGISSDLVKFLEKRKKLQNAQNSIFEDVYSFVNNNKGCFKNVSASQWGVIRSAATRIVDKKDLIKEVISIMGEDTNEEHCLTKVKKRLKKKGIVKDIDKEPYSRRKKILKKR